MALYLAAVLSFVVEVFATSCAPMVVGWRMLNV